MKRIYTREQLKESIRYWEKVLESMDNEYHYDMVETDSDTDVSLDSVDCIERDLLGSVEEILYAYSVQGNIRKIANDIVKMMKAGKTEIEVPGGKYAFVINTGRYNN